MEQSKQPEDINNQELESWLDKMSLLETVFPHETVEKTTLIGVPIKDIEPQYLSQILASCIINYSAFYVSSNETIEKLKAKIESMELSDLAYKTATRAALEKANRNTRSLSNIAWITVTSIVISIASIVMHII